MRKSRPILCHSSVSRKKPPHAQTKTQGGLDSARSPWPAPMQAPRSRQKAMSLDGVGVSTGLFATYRRRLTATARGSVPAGVRSTWRGEGGGARVSGKGGSFCCHKREETGGLLPGGVHNGGAPRRKRPRGCAHGIFRGRSVCHRDCHGSAPPPRPSERCCRMQYRSTRRSPRPATPATPGGEGGHRPGRGTWRSPFFDAPFRTQLRPDPRALSNSASVRLLFTLTEATTTTNTTNNTKPPLTLRFNHIAIHVDSPYTHFPPDPRPPPPRPPTPNPSTTPPTPTPPAHPRRPPCAGPAAGAAASGHQHRRGGGR